MNILCFGASGGIGKILHNGLGEYKFIGLHYCHKKSYTIAKCDITNYKKVQEIVDIVAEHRQIDILINCGAVMIDELVHKSDNFENVVNINLIGTYNTIRAVLPYMRKQQHGRIINMSSIVGYCPQIGTGAYTTAKAGLEGLCKSVALENAKLNISCNNIALGYFDTGMFYKLSLENQKQYLSKIPFGRLGESKEIISTVKYLIETPYITGQTIHVNGGLY